MTRILAIARNTFRENIRDKVLYNLILFALIMILSSLALGKLTLGNEGKVIVDLGLFSISVFGMLISIFIGIGLVYKELEKKTVYVLLSKPVHRYELVLGKYLGLLFTLLINMAIMAAGLEIALLYIGRSGAAAYVRIIPAAYLIFLSLAITTALALLFSTFSTPVLSAVFTFFLWVAGHFGSDLLNFGALTKSALVQWICRVLYYVIPNLSNFNFIDSGNILRSDPFKQAIDPSAIAWASLYCVLYCAIAVSFSVSIFMRRDFK